jgi:UDP-N-acetylmuramoyl-tripeptide--D-alanyl-D-alanine ligase
MFFLLSLFWFIREIKSTLFWLYLWQLKEYHIGRFIDHFRTEKGKKIFFNPYFLLKIILFFTFFQFLLESVPTCPKNISNLFLSYLLITLYFFELAKGFFDFFKKKLKTPNFTKKIIFLIFIIFIFQIFYFFSVFQKELFSFYLLIFDILTPAIVSGIVLIFQPFTALIRYRIIQKAKKKRDEFKNLLVIGITGSYGKTSTKEFLATILEEKFPGKVLKTKEHQNSEVGISQCILNELNENHEIFVVEMGAYNRGGIKLLCDIAQPKIGIITGVNEQHLATFGSMENLLSAEGGEELIDSLPQDGLVIFNGNNKYCLELYKKTKIKKKICYNNFLTAVQNVLSMDIWSQDTKIEKEFINFKVFSKDGDFADFKVNLLGAQNVENVLLAVCCAKELGMNLKEISDACQKIKPEQGGTKLVKTKEGLNIIDSTYSANPDGVMAHLDYLKIWEGKKVIVMPCLIELGEKSKEIHKKIGEKIAEVCDLAVITTKDRFKEIKEEAGDKAIFLENPKEIFEKIKDFSGKDDVILLEGRIPKEIHQFLIF